MISTKTSKYFKTLLIAVVVVAALSAAVFASEAYADTKTGWQKDGKSWYYLDNKGKAKTGWLKQGGKWYYLDPATDGAMRTGKYQVKKKWYISNSSGAMYENGWAKLGKNWYYASASGALKTGWVKSGSKWYWLQPEKDGLMAANQWLQEGKARYYLTSSGAMATKWQKVSNKWYYFNNSGAQKTGWVHDGSWYYLQPEKNGAMLASVRQTINGKLYGFTKSGAMQAGCQVKLENNECGYAAESGAISKIGVFENNKLILKDSTGKTITGWKQMAGFWFYGDKGGVAHTGWLKSGSKWYFMKNDGAMATSAWVDGGKYFVGADGVWQQVNIVKDYRSSLAHGPKGKEYQKYIVIHDTEGGGIPKYVIDGWVSNGRRVAAHFVIGKDGSIVQCVPMDQIAHHAGFGNTGHNRSFGVPEDGRDDKKGTQSIGKWAADYGMNSYSIGIELIHRGASGEAYPKAQLEALDKLIAYIDSYYGKQSTIIDHKMWRNGNSDTSREFARYLANYRDHRSYK